jgi:N-methylhydantoinase B
MVIQKAFADAWDGYGRAEGASGRGPASAVISGRDRRRHGEPYVNQKIAGAQGGPAGPAVDGWVTYQNAVTAGLMFRDSVELDEQRYPIRISEIRVRRDSEGAGERRGAPGARIGFGPRFDPMTAHYIVDGNRFVPRGVRGGLSGGRSEARKILADGSEVEIAPISEEEVRPGEVLIQHTGGGGGYGSPLEREPERVREDVLRGFVSFARARDVYGVRFEREALEPELAVDAEGTAKLRARMRGAAER